MLITFTTGLQVGIQISKFYSQVERVLVFKKQNINKLCRNGYPALLGENFINVLPMHFDSSLECHIDVTNIGQKTTHPLGSLVAIWFFMYNFYSQSSGQLAPHKITTMFDEVD